MLRDVQSEPPSKPLPLKKVGVRGVKWPLKVMRRDGGYQDTVSTVNMYVELSSDKRGVHMSRFIEALRSIDRVNPQVIHSALRALKERLEADRSYLELHFTYFMWKSSPVTGERAPIPVEAYISADSLWAPELLLGVSVPVMTLCPCSKAISDRGAHNQRATVRVWVRSSKLVWFEELVEICESSASSPVYTILKRPDEKYVTEHAYDNPKFVEDVARDISSQLSEDKRLSWYKVEVESYESIHPHQAFACMEGEVRMR